MELEVHGGVGDVAGFVVDADLALVFRGDFRVEHHVPGVRRRLDVVSVPHQQVGAAPVRDPVVDAFEGVVGLVLEVAEDRLVVGDEVGVDRGDEAGGDQPGGGVARGGDAVVLPGFHQLDHFVGGAGFLVVDLAAGFLFERLAPGGFDVAGPGDQRDFALSFADLLQGFIAAAAAGRVAAAATTGEGEHENDQAGDDEPRRAGGVAIPFAHFGATSCLVDFPPTAAACSGRHPTRTSFPCPGNAPEDALSTFCRTTWSCSPCSSPTVKRVTDPA